LVNDHVNGSHARNEGLKIAKGDFISFLDDDDFYLETYVEYVFKEFEKNKNIDFVFCDVAFISREGVSRIVTNASITSEELLFGQKEIGTGSNVCFRKATSNITFFDERYLRYQDIEYVVKQLTSHKSVWLKELKIVKYYNANENYLHYKKALDMQKLLREDMLKKEIINSEQVKRLKSIQIRTLYHDMMVKNMDKKDVCVVYNILKENSINSTIDKIVFFLYLISPKLFKMIYKRIFNSNNKEGNIVAIKLLEKRKELKELAICA